MRKTLLALFFTTVGIAALIGVKVQSAGSPRPALADPPVTGQGASPAGGARTPAAHSAASGRYTGQAVGTRYGTVQVQAVLANGKLADVNVLQQTSGGRSSQIDSYSLPILKSEALRAQSARIDVVSGATYTSDGYARSLQAALDTARR